MEKKAIRDEKPFHKADVQETWADISKAKKLLNWEPTISLDQGLSETVNWYFKNKNWFKRCRLSSILNILTKPKKNCQ